MQVVIYEDLQCSDCARFGVMLDQQLLPKYGDRVEFERRDFPLDKHAWARQAAIAARYFGESSSDLALAYRRYALDHLSETTLENFTARLAGFAREHGMDPGRAVAALEDPRFQALVQQDIERGLDHGIARTPTVLVNGRTFVETIPLEEISKAIDSELARVPI